MDHLQEMGGGDVGHVEGRVLAHQDHVDGRQVEQGFRAQAGVIARLPAHLQGPGPGIDPPVPEAQVLGQVVVQAMAAALGLQGQHEAAVGIDVDRLDRVHLDGDGEAHGSKNLSICGSGAL
jgi:hypothetical protein